MKHLKEEKLFSKRWFLSYFYIILGCALFSVGNVMFVNPYLLAPGGAYGIATVLNAVHPWKISYYALCMEIPLLIIGTFVLGPRFGTKTVLCTVLIFAFVWILETFYGYAPLIHDGMLPTKGANGLNFIPDYFLNTLVAGLIYGVAVGLIFKSGATSGGIDIVVMIINKYTNIPLGRIVVIVDSAISLLTLIVFKQIRLPIYSILLIVIMGKIIDLVIEGTKSYKTVLIISEHVDEIRDIIINQLDRSATKINGTGLYLGKERNIIYVTLLRKEFVYLRNELKEIDPNAFINVIDSNEIVGHGFSMKKNVL
ncbi:MAG: YitT family protein [Bacteroidales bacterium]|jgi:uncharacterized membrane-anchored protein YitT (DUF2179 family)